MNDFIGCACRDDGTCERYRRGRVADTTAQLIGGERRGKCYQLALNYVLGLPDDGVVLVHGTLGEGDQQIGHGWVVEADGWVWEPVNDLWAHSEEAFLASQLHGQPTERFQPSEARAKADAGEMIGVYNPVPPSPAAPPADTDGDISN